MHDLANHHLQALAVRCQRLGGGDHAGDIAAVVGAPDIDHYLRAARHLVGVVGDVVGEIGVGAVAFLQRAVHVVAELGGAEQGLGARLPIVGGFALGRFQHAFVDQAGLAQGFDRAFHGAAFEQGALAGEHVVHHAQCRQILADGGDHLGDGEVAHRVQPEGSGGHGGVRAGEGGAMGLR